MTFDIDNCTVQEACDYAVKKIVEQGGRCRDALGCVYGNGLGEHCSIGWLLPEDNDALMGAPLKLDALVCEFGAEVPELIRENEGAFYLLQSFHDVATKKMRISDMGLLSREYGIDTSGDHWQQWVEMGV